MYNYREAMVKDIKQYIINNNFYRFEDETDDEYIEHLNDDLWGEDCITGNGPYGYAPEENCEEYVAGNLILFFQAVGDWGIPLDDITIWRKLTTKPASYMDTIIRCWLLPQCVEKAVKEMKVKED